MVLSVLVLLFAVVFLIDGCATPSVNDLTNTVSAVSISSFERSDQFLVDFDDVKDGHMYKGKNSDAPHTGAHVVFDISNNTAKKVSDYPKIYAVADAIVDRIDLYHPVKPSGQLTHYRYGVDLSIAERDGTPIIFHYSIEPFVNPKDTSFYEPFILVKKGDKVSKGDVIAHMYVSTNVNVHIHFNLKWDQQFQAPAIFTQSVMAAFYEQITTENGGVKNYVHYVNGTPKEWMNDCMGFKISEVENPFETKAVDCLK